MTWILFEVHNLKCLNDKAAACISFWWDGITIYCDSSLDIHTMLLYVVLLVNCRRVEWITTAQKYDKIYFFRNTITEKINSDPGVSPREIEK